MIEHCGASLVFESRCANGDVPQEPISKRLNSNQSSWQREYANLVVGWGVGWCGAFRIAPRTLHPLLRAPYVTT